MKISFAAQQRIARQIAESNGVFTTFGSARAVLPADQRDQFKVA